MRVLLIIKIILVSWTIDTKGQIFCEEGKTISVNEKGDSIVAYVEKMPYLKDGFEPHMKWIKNNMDKRLVTKKKEEKKTVYISFVVHEDGMTSDFKIAKGIGDLTTKKQ